MKGYKAIYLQISRATSRVKPKKSNLETLESLCCDYQLIDTEEKRKEIIQKLLTSKILSLDTETTGTEPMDAELVGMSFSIAENEAFYVPVPANQEEALKIVNEFRPVFENESSLKVGQNIKYDMIVLQNYGVEVKGPLFDTMIAHYVLQPELRHGMDYLAEIYLHYQTIHIDELIGPKGKNQKNMRDLAPKDVYRYACEDADVTLKLKNVLEKELKENGAERLFYDIEMPLVPVLVNIERNGVLLDTEALKQSSAHFTEQMERIEKEIYDLAGETFNIASPKQVGEVLFDKLKIVEKPKDKDRAICHFGRGSRKSSPQTSGGGENSGTPRTEEVTGNVYRRTPPTYQSTYGKGTYLFQSDCHRYRTSQLKQSELTEYPPYATKTGKKSVKHLFRMKAVFSFPPTIHRSNYGLWHISVKIRI